MAFPKRWESWNFSRRRNASVRLSFVPIEIDDVNNAQNPLLPRSYAHDGVAHRNRLETYRRA